MSWIQSVGEIRSLEGILRQRPELLSRYTAFVEGIWRDSGLSPRLLDLVATRISMIHGLDGPPSFATVDSGLSNHDQRRLAAGDFDDFSDAERAALAIAELMPMAHEQIGDQDVADVSHAVGHKGCVALLIAAAFFDVNCRLQIVWAA